MSDLLRENSLKSSLLSPSQRKPSLRVGYSCNYFFKNCIGRKLINNIVLFLLYSKMTQVYLHILYHMFFHYGLSQNIECSSLCYMVGPCLSILCTGLHLLAPSFQSFPPPAPLTLGNHKPVLCVYESVSILYMCPFVSYFRFHMQVISYGFCHYFWAHCYSFVY